MLFDRRSSEPLAMRVRVALWPRRSVGRSLRYVGLRVLRLAGSPHGLAMGVAAGVFIASLPLPGAQLILAALLAWMLGGNVPAALLATFWANPLTLPVLWLASYWLGQFFLTGAAAPPPDVLAQIAQLSQVALSVLSPGRQSLVQAYAALWPLLKPLALGAVVLGSISAVVFYGLTVHLIAGYRAERRARLARAIDQPDASALPMQIAPAA